MDVTEFFEVMDKPLTISAYCPKLCNLDGCADGPKCVAEPPLPEGIANTEVTPEGKEAFQYYRECLIKECEDASEEVGTGLIEGVPGGCATCDACKESYTCDFETVEFFEVIDKPMTIGAYCPKTCNFGGCADG